MRALVLIDLQKEWINRRSDFYLRGADQAIDNINQLIDYCRKENYKIIFTRHEELDGEGEFDPKTQNVELIPRLYQNKIDPVIIKNKIDPFYKTSLEEELLGVEEVVTAGILTNLCVRSFIEGAYDREFDITVIKDCCVARDEETQDFTFLDLKNTRPEVEFLELEDFLEEDWD
jgi:nicotinamidase-related amidase